MGSCEPSTEGALDDFFTLHPKILAGGVVFKCSVHSPHRETSLQCRFSVVALSGAHDSAFPRKLRLMLLRLWPPDHIVRAGLCTLAEPSNTPRTEPALTSLG